MRYLEFMAVGAVTVAAALGTGRTSGQGQQQSSSKSNEYNVYQAAHNQENRQLRVKLLAEFAAKYPNSDFLPDAYRDAYMTHFSLGDYPQTIEYVDKYLVFRPKIDSSDRLETLITRAEAFLAGCVDAELRTPEAYGGAATAAKEGLEAVAQIPKSPDCIQPGPCRSERERIRSLFNSVDQITEAGLKGETVDCGPAMFNHVIDDLRGEERQTPRVR